MRRAHAVLVGMMLLHSFAGAGAFEKNANREAHPDVFESQPDDQAVKTAIEALPAFVEEVMAKTGVPGLAIAIVHRDRVVFAQGFGVRHVEKGGEVTPDTVFQVASVSKPLGASAVAAAVGRGKCSWDTAVLPLLPEFALADPWVAEHVNIGDLYAHRSGLPAEFGNDLERLGFDRQEIIERAHLVPLAPFRATYAYSNFGLTLGGVAAARAAGAHWDEFTREYLFEPLGMSRSTFRHAEFAKMENVASLHQEVGGRWVPGPPRNADAQAPAGGASSTVNDLARWMRMLLARGAFEGERVVEESALGEMLSLQIRNSGDPVEGIGGYGFGIGVSADAGAPIVWTHSGAFTNGAATQVYLVPGLDLGIVTLTNGWPIGVPEAINQTFVDLVRLGRPSEDWLASCAALFAAYTTPTHSVDGHKKPQSPAPAADHSSYTGRYYSDYAGFAEVAFQEDSLVVTIGPEGRTVLPLRHWDGDTFYFTWRDLPEGFYQSVRFTRTPSGRAKLLAIDDINSGLGTFHRVD